MNLEFLSPDLSENENLAEEIIKQELILLTSLQKMIDTLLELHSQQFKDTIYEHELENVVNDLSTVNYSLN